MIFSNCDQMCGIFQDLHTNILSLFILVLDRCPSPFYIIVYMQLVLSDVLSKMSQQNKLVYIRNFILSNGLTNSKQRGQIKINSFKPFLSPFNVQESALTKSLHFFMKTAWQQQQIKLFICCCF